MKSCHRILASLSLFLCGAASSQAQFYKVHNGDLAVSGTGQFTTSITSQNNVPHQWTTDGLGFLGTFREHPVAWAGIELNYGYTPYSERYTADNGSYLANIPLSMHEATAAYLFHPHFRHFQPFVGVGGGALYFHPYPLPYTTQWRGTGLLEVGFDIPTKNPHLGFRAQGRSLLYRAPNFNDANIATSRWYSTNEPSAGVYVRF